jgi:hypothetical protein
VWNHFAYAAAAAALALATPHSQTPDPAADAAAAPTLVVWTFETATLGAAERDTGLRLAKAMLATAGVTVRWRLCGADDPCLHTAGEPPRVTLILTSALRPACGTAVRDPDGRTGTILVSLPCVERGTRNMQSRLAARAYPRRTTLDRSHLLGAVVAHEIAHILGVPHTDHGIMRPRLDLGDVLALRDGHLAFDPIQATRIRIAAAGEPVALSAAHR